MNSIGTAYAIDLGSVHIEARDQRDQIGDHDSRADLVDDAHGGEGTGADPHPVRILAAIADDIIAHVSARRFDAHVGFACRRLELARDLGDGRPVGYLVDALAKNLATLHQFLDPDLVAVVGVAHGPPHAPAHRHLEVELGIDRIGNVPADVPLDAARTQVGTHQVVLESILLRDHRDVGQSLDEDLVVRQEPVVFVDNGLEVVEERNDPAAGLRLDVVADAADPEVVVGEAGAADLLHEVVDAFPLPERVQKGSDGADILPEGAHRDEVAGDAIELAGDDAAVLGAGRHLDVAQPLRRHAEALIGEHGGEVIGPVGVRDVTVPRAFLADLLDGAVQVADVRDGFVDDLAVRLDHEPQHAVGARMLRPHVQRHVFRVQAGPGGSLAHDIIPSSTDPIAMVDAGGFEIRPYKSIAHTADKRV